MKRFAFVLAIVLAALPAAAQDTVVEFKLERHLPKNWDAFIEINGVEKFVEGFKASKTNDLVKAALAAVAEQGGPDVPALFEQNFGTTPEELAGFVKGQLAVGLQIRLREGLGVIATADCRTEENARKLFDLIVKRFPNAEAVDIDDLKGMKAPNGATIVAAGPVVWMGSTWKTAKDFVGRRQVGASKPIGDDDVFKKARESAGAAPGGLFAWANLGKFTPFLALAPDEAKDLVEKSGVTALTGYAASVRFDGGRVIQRHILQAGEKAGGLLGDLLAMEDRAAGLAATPKDTAAAVHLSKTFVGIVQRVIQLARDASGGEMEPELERILAPVLTEAVPFAAKIVKGGEGFAMVFDGAAAVEVFKNLLDLALVNQVMTDDKEVDGATISTLLVPDGDFPFKAVGTTKERAYLGFDAALVEGVHKAINAGGANVAGDADVKALVEGGSAEGVLVAYVDFALVDEVVNAFAERIGRAGLGKAEAAAMKVLGSAGRSVDIVRVDHGSLIIESRSTTGLSLLTTVGAAAVAGAANRR